MFRTFSLSAISKPEIHRVRTELRFGGFVKYVVRLEQTIKFHIRRYYLSCSIEDIDVYSITVSNT